MRVYKHVNNWIVSYRRTPNGIRIPISWVFSTWNEAVKFAVEYQYH